MPSPSSPSSGKLPASEASVAANSGISGQGIFYGICAYGLWGLMPLYFLFLMPAGPIEIVANRVVWSLVFCILLLTFTRSWRSFIAIFQNPRILGLLSLAAVLVAGNWLIYVYGVVSQQAVEAALGYFINPLFSVLLGVLVLKERLRPLQWIAVGVGTIAVLELSFAYGKIPWIALGLALTFGFYSLVKKQVGSRVTAVTSLSVETSVLTPVALLVMGFLAWNGTATLTALGPEHFWWMVSSGVMTAVPLLFFAASARRLPMTMIGFLQYLGPLIQFTIAVAVLHEPMPPERWLGFGIVWLALLILLTDMLFAARKQRKLRHA